ncbi:hypothetical protein C8F04DRAFT_1188202 [Mycena alexandri]|uniref:Uncharacterized protein n=1 Tax=Mycena alexandri TaxID=1745969 RepID=A0AAD6WVI9_9AGAR|nr:hypothetical protein C8F04DRAFT_1188202 [Mycena alexandri]
MHVAAPKDPTDNVLSGDKVRTPESRRASSANRIRPHAQTTREENKETRRNEEKTKHTIPSRRRASKARPRDIKESGRHPRPRVTPEQRKREDEGRWVASWMRTRQAQRKNGGRIFVSFLSSGTGASRADRGKWMGVGKQPNTPPWIRAGTRVMDRITGTVTRTYIRFQLLDFRLNLSSPQSTSVRFLHGRQVSGDTKAHLNFTMQFMMVDLYFLALS